MFLRPGLIPRMMYTLSVSSTINTTECKKQQHHYFKVRLADNVKWFPKPVIVGLQYVQTKS